MLPRVVRRSAWAAVAAVGVLLVPATAALADSAPPAQVRSDFENTYGASLDRDCGFSTPLPANPAASLWLFCDTAIYGLNKQLQYQQTGFITGSTAAEGPFTAGAVPQGLSELPTPGTPLPAMPNSDGPAQFLFPPRAMAPPPPFRPPFLGTPGGLVTSTGQPCDSANGAYAASWISGVAQEPATANPADVLITYGNYCVQGPLTFEAEGFGIAEYDPATNTVQDQATIFTGTAAPPQQMLVSPVFSGSYLYLFGSECSSKDQYGDCTSGSVYLARTGDTASSWDSPSSYRWRDGGTWTPTASSATSIIPSATPVSAVSAGNFSSVGQGIVLIAQTSLAGNFVAYEPVSSLTGTWQQVISASVPCGSGTSLCHAIIGHPELSTTGDLMVSYFDPGQGPAGHVMADEFAW
jgi:hypothetical protein